jgi:uncharacterized membrane protein
MKKEYKEIDEILNKIDKLEEKILKKRPSHFRKRDIINAFFGSLLFGLTFMFKGRLFDMSLRLPNLHVLLIIAATVILLTVEIYYIAYSRVPASARKERRFGQFWLKRFTTIYGIAIITSFLLVYLYGIHLLVPSFGSVCKIVVAVSFPCAVGAAVPSLLKKY